MRFGRLTVGSETLREVGIKRRRLELHWVCNCDCGKQRVARSCQLTSGGIQSCGCLRKETSLKAIKNATDAWRTHGESLNKTPIYKLWSRVKSRCGSNRHSTRIYYKDRGIDMCQEWREDYLAFKAWAESNGFDPSLQIDRIDNDKGYAPDNCRFVTPKQQAQNRRKMRPHGSVGVRSKK